MKILFEGCYYNVDIIYECRQFSAILVEHDIAAQGPTIDEAVDSLYMTMLRQAIVDREHGELIWRSGEIIGLCNPIALRRE